MTFTSPWAFTAGPEKKCWLESLPTLPFLKAKQKEPPSLQLQVKGYLLAPALGIRVAFGIPQGLLPPLLAGAKQKARAQFSRATLA